MTYIRQISITCTRKIGFIWIFLSVLSQAAAAIFAKKAALVSYGGGWAAIVLNGWYMLELMALFCQACCWIMALRNFPLSFAYPFMSLVIGLNLLSAWLFFGEAIAKNHVIGICFVIIGVILIKNKAES